MDQWGFSHRQHACASAIRADPPGPEPRELPAMEEVRRMKIQVRKVEAVKATQNAT
ncbi:hypothetical protein GCM10027168_00270 [Streptomyces capparidis]